MSCSQVLIVGGTVLEIAGVLTVVFEIADSLRRSREIRPKGVTVHLSPAREYSHADLALTTPGPPPAADERIDALEEQVPALGKQLRDEIEIRKRQDAQLDELPGAIQDLTDSFNRLLSDVLRAGLHARVAGVVLIVAGIVASSAGSFISA